jgi:hypothetical protein
MFFSDFKRISAVRRVCNHVFEAAIIKAERRIMTLWRQSARRARGYTTAGV